MHSMPPTLTFSVCIITFRRPALLQQCLDCIAPSQQTLDPSKYEVVVSDDCPDQSARYVVEHSGFARWIQGPSQGIAANRNNAAKAANGDWLVFVDDDELPTPQWLEKMFASAVTRKWDAIVGPVEPVDYPDSIFWYAPTLRGGTFGAGNLAICKSFLARCGGFDESLKISHEDTELGERISSLGARILFHDSALVLHPARRMSLQEVCSRAVQQQCQSYRLHNSDSQRAWPDYPAFLVWNLKYLYRSFKLQFAVADPRRWKSFILRAVLGIVCWPVACFQLIIGK
jgi:GT2 family glycosyltransferase